MDYNHDKTVWLEGMFLSPQHFQQQERYVEHYGRQLFNILAPDQAGFTALRIDSEQLKTGKIFVREAKGIFPDGTPFELIHHLCRDIDKTNSGSYIYLALPLTRSGSVDTASSESINKSIRNLSYDHMVRDSTNHENDPVQMELSRLNFCLLIDGESLDDYSTLPIARIQESRSDGELVLDNAFIPRCLDYRVSRYLQEQVQNLQAMMQQRASVIAGQIGVEGEQKSFQTMQVTYMWLQALNRYNALLRLIGQQSGVCTATLYRYLTVIAADLATFTSTLAPEFPHFDESNTFASFAPVIASLRLNLKLASKDRVITLVWDDRLFELRRLLRTKVEDRTLFNDGRFILAVASSLNQNQARNIFISSAKLCGQNRIAERVRSALSAVPITVLATPPIELRTKPNTVYFEVDTSNELWQEMVNTRDMLALHVDQQMPDDTAINCYVIR
ncbi:type VI secretion system-associated protein [Endozoicomonas sp. (ex Bugula neritina AB1)]|nr:type VI secretion system-associated protein [Endozoicomonas sp. (ex Bugula neritina AB1)]